jgi:hypothetical protein
VAIVVSSVITPPRASRSDGVGVEWAKNTNDERMHSDRSTREAKAERAHGGKINIESEWSLTSIGGTRKEETPRGASAPHILPPRGAWRMKLNEE